MDQPDNPPMPGSGHGPTPTPFRPGESPLPDSLSAPRADDRSGILLVSGEEDTEWAAEAAVDLATRWATAGRRVVLLDLHLDSPVLHEHLGVENLEGVVDVFLYGASLARIARLVEGRGFYLISSGTPASDPGSIHRSSRWQKLVDGFGEANAVLLVFAPASADIEALSTWIPDTVVLGGDERLSPGRAPRAVLLPPAAAGASAPAEAVPTEPLPAPTASEALPGEVGAPEPALAEEDEDVDWAAADLEPELAMPTTLSARRRRRKGRGISTLVWIVLVIVVLAVLAATLWFLRPDLFPVPGANDGDAVAAPSVAEVSAAAEPAADPVAEALPFSIQVRTYSSLRSAREDVGQAARRFRETEFFVAPEIVEGALFYKIFAGAFPDTMVAAQVRDRLVDRGIADPEEAFGRWSLIRAVPLAFDLGLFESPAGAADRAEALLAQGVPSYPMQILYADGEARWRLYGGAYPGQEEAAGMRRLLDEAGVTASLVDRVGSHSATGA